MTAEERIARGIHADEASACTPAHAREIIGQVLPYQQRLRRAHGETVLHLADEYYLSAGAALPPATRYDGFAQYENGIGMTRHLLADWRRVSRRSWRTSFRSVSFVCGTLIAPTLRDIATEFGQLTGLRTSVYAIENTFFGARVNVSGLLVSRDIESQLQGRNLGEICVLPRYALDYTGSRFLDNRTPGELQTALRVPLAFASTMSDVLQILTEPLESQQSTVPRPERSNGKAWVDWTLRTPSPGGRGLAKEVRG
jgi:NifB/MoaA-like Fe-S oxidoreductase